MNIGEAMNRGEYFYVMGIKGSRADAVIALWMEVKRLRAAIRKTLDDNGHLSDGENCTLIELKRAIGKKKDPD